MKLEEFIKHSGMKKKSFAEAIGISPVNLWKILKGVTTPSLKTAIKIVSFTQGNVSMRELILSSSKGDIPSLHQRLDILDQRLTQLENKRSYEKSFS